MLKLFGKRFYFKSTDAGSSSLTKGCHKRAGIFRQLTLTLILIVAGAASVSAATFHVQSIEDNSLCGLSVPLTLKCAINQAEANGAIPDVIVLQNGATYTVSTPQSAETGFQNITTPIHIIGNGAIIRRVASSVPLRFFQVHPAGDLTLENLTLRGGEAFNGGAIRNFGKLKVINSILENNESIQGGAISNSSIEFSLPEPTVIIDKSTLRNNSAEIGGGLYSVGGSISPIPAAVVMTVTITNSSFINNQASRAGGGLEIANAHNLIIYDTTISGNAAQERGGGIFLSTPAKEDAEGTLLTLVLHNLTVANNSAGSSGGGIDYSICGAMSCPPAAQVTLTNSIVAKNAAPTNENIAVNVFNFLVSGGYNIIDPGTTGNCCYSSSSLDIPNITASTFAANYSPLTTNGNAGGEYHRPYGLFSIGVDKAIDGSLTDQLGFSRVGPVDIGAIEALQCAAAPSNMVGWWRFDELTGNTSFDFAGFPNNGVRVNGPTLSPGMVGGALRFNGSDQYVGVNNHPEIDFAGDCSNDAADFFTIDAWVKTSAAGVQVIVDKRRFLNSAVIGYSLFISDGRLGFQMAHGAGNQLCGSLGSACTNFVAPSTLPNLNDNRWHFVAVTVSRCRIAIGRMYIDGNLVHTFRPSFGGISNNADLLIGGGYSNGNNVNSFFKGSLDEVEIFKRVLPRTEIRAIYNAGWVGKCRHGLPSLQQAADIEPE